MSAKGQSLPQAPAAKLENYRAILRSLHAPPACASPRTRVIRSERERTLHFGILKRRQYKKQNDHALEMVSRETASSASANCS